MAARAEQLAPHQTDEARILTTFRDLGVFAETADALAAVGITTPFPVQAMTLPVALAGNDVIGQAKTGTGKTLGFGVPLLQRIEAPAPAGRVRPQALVVVPTRELCVQVAGDLTEAGALRAVRVLAVYGGRAAQPQVKALRQGVDVVVGTPGRLLDMAQQGHLVLSEVRVLVLDEADEMLDLGFLPDVERIVALTPTTRQTMLFSATMPDQVVALGRRYMSRPVHIRATDPAGTGATVASVTQHAFRAHPLDKVELLARVLQADGRGLAMVFCRTKRTAAKIAAKLGDRGFAAAAVHGDLGQGAREQALRAFRSGKVDVLVATDVAARGLDVEDVTHVINFQCPEDDKAYLHRIGRTGRAGRAGTAITLVDWAELPRWALIDRALDLSLGTPPETYSTSDHLYTGLGIPRQATGELPTSRRTRAGLDAERLEDVGGADKRARRARPRRRSGTTGRVAATSGISAAVGGVDGSSRPALRRPRRRRRSRGGQPTAA